MQHTGYSAGGGGCSWNRIGLKTVTGGGDGKAFTQLYIQEIQKLRVMSQNLQYFYTDMPPSEMKIYKAEKNYAFHNRDISEDSLASK